MRNFTALLTLALFCTSGNAAQPISLNAKAPELTGKQWLNSEPISLAARKGKVTVVHFWTYGCINCKHNLPSYANWQQQLAGRDVAIIGVHTPEFDHERVASNVEKKVTQFGITLPVLLDPAMENWRRWSQQYWPCVYLIDKKGHIRYRWDGELNYGGSEGEKIMLGLIEKLLTEPS